MQRVVPAPAGGFETASYMNVTLSCDHRVRCRLWIPHVLILPKITTALFDGTCRGRC